MANKKIIWSHIVKLEFQNILNFYTERNESVRYSLKLLNETEALLKTLLNFHEKLHQ